MSNRDSDRGESSAAEHSAKEDKGYGYREFVKNFSEETMSVREIEGYLNRVEEIKNSENAFLERMRTERLQKEERYASPERKREI